jgi:hypothetical protein
MIVKYYDGWAFLHVPWLAGMVGWYLFEFIEGNTVTRIFFMRLHRMTREALEAGHFTTELQRARRAGAVVHSLSGFAGAVPHHRTGSDQTDDLDDVLGGINCGDRARHPSHKHHPTALPVGLRNGGHCQSILMANCSLVECRNWP